MSRPNTFDDEGVQDFPEAPPEMIANRSGGAIEREVTSNNRPGRFGRLHDPRRYPFDEVRGLQTMVAFGTTKADRMPVEEASARMARIFSIFGIEREPEGFLRAFVEAMFISYTLNSGSVLTPASRIAMTVKGFEYDYTLVMRELGVDLRRFHRTYANDIAEANKRLIYHYDVNDFVQMEMRDQVLNVALRRGLHRYPHLCFDTADCMSNLGLDEYAAINQAGQTVKSITINAVDRLDGIDKSLSADKFDSTNLRPVAHADRGHKSY